MVKALIFDCFGVLTTDHWKEFVGTLPAEQRRAASDLNRAYCRSHMTQAELLRSLHELTGKPLPVLTNANLNNEQSKNVQLLEFIASLRPTYKIGLLSNVASSWITERFLTPREQELFDSFILSYEVGLAKPDPEIFAVTADRLGVKPQDCMLIDDVAYYCEIAREQGMQAIVYENFAQMKRELEPLLKTT